MIMNANHTDLMGDVVTWDTSSTLASHAEVCLALKDADLPPDAASELSNRSAFGRACKDLKADRAIDKLETKGKVARFQFTKKHVDSAGLLDYDYECVVELDLGNGDITCPENAALEVQAQSLFATAMQLRNAQDITRLVQKLFKENADLYPVNPRKGVAYFVPAQHADFTDKVETFLKSLGGTLWRFPVPKGTDAGNASVRDAVQGGLSSLLGELQETVSNFGDSTKERTMERVMERYQTIAYKVDAYAEYLGSEQQKLQDKLAEAKEDLKQKILALHEKESQEEAPADATSAAAAA